MSRVIFPELDRVIEWSSERPLLHCLLEAGLTISHICDGDGACGTCRIEVLEGWQNLSPRTPDEVSKEVEAPYRLSCQTRARGDVAVRVAKID